MVDRAGGVLDAHSCLSGVAMMDLFTDAMTRERAAALTELAKAGQRMDTQAYNRALKKAQEITKELLRAENAER